MSHHLTSPQIAQPIDMRWYTGRGGSRPGSALKSKKVVPVLDLRTHGYGVLSTEWLQSVLGESYDQFKVIAGYNPDTNQLGLQFVPADGAPRAAVMLNKSMRDNRTVWLTGLFGREHLDASVIAGRLPLVKFTKRTRVATFQLGG